MKTKMNKEINKLVILGIIKKEFIRSLQPRNGYQSLQPRNGHTQKRIVIYQNYLQIFGIYR